MSTSMKIIRLYASVDQLRRLYRAAMQESAEVGQRVSVSEVVRRLIDEKYPPTK